MLPSFDRTRNPQPTAHLFSTLTLTLTLTLSLSPNPNLEPYLGAGGLPAGHRRAAGGAAADQVAGACGGAAGGRPGRRLRPRRVAAARHGARAPQRRRVRVLPQLTLKHNLSLCPECFSQPLLYTKLQRRAPSSCAPLANHEGSGQGARVEKYSQALLVFNTMA